MGRFVLKPVATQTGRASLAFLIGMLGYPDDSTGTGYRPRICIEFANHALPSLCAVAPVQAW